LLQKRQVWTGAGWPGHDFARLPVTGLRIN